MKRIILEVTDDFHRELLNRSRLKAIADGGPDQCDPLVAFVGRVAEAIERGGDTIQFSTRRDRLEREEKAKCG